MATAVVNVEQYKNAKWKCGCGSTKPWRMTAWENVADGMPPCCDNSRCSEDMHRVSWHCASLDDALGCSICNQLPQPKLETVPPCLGCSEPSSCVRKCAVKVMVTPEKQKAPPEPEMVNRPSHYHASSGIEAIAAIEAWGLGFALGNVVKYVARAESKGERLRDLQKARWYLDRAIAELSPAKE